MIFPNSKSQTQNNFRTDVSKPINGNSDFIFICLDGSVYDNTETSSKKYTLYFICLTTFCIGIKTHDWSPTNLNSISYPFIC